jgi:hypothetical protein
MGIRGFGYGNTSHEYAHAKQVNGLGQREKKRGGLPNCEALELRHESQGAYHASTTLRRLPILREPLP